jgi:dTDP-glucose 4,6-dehydratase
MVTNKNLLITGGCGFIGSNFVRYMLENYQDCSIINLDKLTYAGNSDNLRDIEKDLRYSFIKGDICDIKTVDKVMANIDIVVHFAAETHVDRSIHTGTEFVNTNVLGTNVLLESAMKNDIKKFIHVSTDEVYGSIKSGSFIETDMLKPSSPYSASKAGSDLLVNSYFVTHGFPAIITRCTNNFGPYQYPEKLIPLFITNLLEDKKVPVYGTGNNIRDWIYVLDHCRAIDFIIQKGKNGEIYNIGSGNERRNIEITENILKLLEKDKSMIQFVEDRKGHDFRYSLDFSKLKTLGWKPAYDFKTALSETVQWYRHNRRWWEKLKR